MSSYLVAVHHCKYTHHTSLGHLLQAAKPHVVHVKDPFSAFIDFLWGAGRPGVKSFPPAIFIRSMDDPNVFTSMHLLLVNLLSRVIHFSKEILTKKHFKFQSIPNGSLVIGSKVKCLVLS